ncbi:ParB N-terminal domain-containing protein [Actinoplanes awajinensis]|uniref:Uncharacterized protein n=1 Tax=Actinoplanes awajinensis subsp. mycoplanecinus TaxID=135947 RepID=A0A0X3V407_9ACTN|nr:hypothetical protein [Actinoplanes awajinensis]KUL39519.1 hypothetical protein ADL15_09680 [Actinoplanes awajinensis subsp. mycoplanecinus]
MARQHATPADFDLVGMSSDPAPGDPDQIQGVVQRYADIADAAERALNVLKKDGSIAAGRGSAMDKLREKVGDDLPDKLAKTQRSYQDAADAYRAYMPRLLQAQQTFDRAVEQARSASPQAGQTVPPLAPEATPADRAAATRAQNDIDAAKGQMSAARGLAEQARSMRESAERTCADALDRAASEAIPERNIFQKIADFFEDFPFVQILLGILIAAVAVFFPVVGFLLGATLFAITQIAAISSGKFKLGDFLVGLISLVPGGSVLKVVGAGVKAGAGLAAKVVPNFAKTVKASLGTIKTSINSSKTIGPLVNSNTGRIVKEAGKGAADKATDETATQVLNGEGLDAGKIVAVGAGGAVVGAAAGRKKITAEGGGIPVKTAPPAGGTRSRGFDTPPASPVRIDPPDPTNIGIDRFKFKRDGDSLEFKNNDFPDETFVLHKTDEFDPAIFKVKRTGEQVFLDDENKFRKVIDDKLDFDGPRADFTKFQGELPKDHFLVDGLEGKDIPKVGGIGDLRGLKKGDVVLVPTGQFPPLSDKGFFRAEFVDSRVDSIVKGFREGAALPPVQLKEGSLALDQGNHRLAAAVKLNLPFVPVTVS